MKIVFFIESLPMELLLYRIRLMLARSTAAVRVRRCQEWLLAPHDTNSI
jgi:hypothetical protein